ncbi:hypothetical protein [Rhodobacter sp. SY28-1]|uniref:hypothetical protein n=1 Tax=Rhodobacter sp. SY28-1 TaxID=2562317 RepID=UPI0010C07034|nr:hypothetical protein [Rhodobacter sp. SY28-1]
MLRLLIGTGVLLMAVGFGAAGWQYWQTLPPAEPGAAVAAVESAAAQPSLPAVTRQSWLMSPTGDVIPQDEVRAYLAQERFAPSRTVLVTQQASLTELLAEGETLPEEDYLQVLADIRAPRVAEGLCAVLVQAFASDCAVHSARVVDGSVDPVAGTAEFRLELVYRLPEPPEELPDLAAHVFQTAVVELPQDEAAPLTPTADAALGAALAAVTGACAAETVGDLCRMQRLTLDWTPGEPPRAQAVIGWLDPLPDGMFVAPPLTTAPGG